MERFYIIVVCLIIIVVGFVAFQLSHSGREKRLVKNYPPSQQASCCPISLQSKETTSGLMVRGAPEVGGWIQMMAWTRTYQFLKNRYKKAQSITLKKITLTNKGDILVTALVDRKVVKVCITSQEGLIREQ